MNEPENRSLDILIDKSIYSLSATKRAAHRFTDTHFVEISDLGSALGVRLTIRNETLADSDIRARFHTALLDESLRETILNETRDIRDSLIAAAFGNARPRGTAPDTDP